MAKKKEYRIEVYRPETDEPTSESARSSHAAKVADLEAKVATWRRKRALAETKLANYTKALARWKGRAP